MSHVESYRTNDAYAAFLEDWDPSFFAKYVDHLAEHQAGGKILDVGCGVGQVVKALRDRKLDAQGVDVSKPNIRKANDLVGHCELYDGGRLPFSDGQFDAAGAFNVLEHVDEPEQFLEELVRVVRPGGRLVVSSPNFLRVLGFRDYHPRMRGLTNKYRNARRQWQIRSTIKHAPQRVRFERMTPIVKDPFTPDDDAIVVTNPLEMSFFLEQAGCEIVSVSSTDRYVSSIVEWGLNLPILKSLWFNSFVVATRIALPKGSSPL